MSFLDAQLLNRYYEEKIGPLNDQEYIAMKAVSKKGLLAVEIERIIKVDAFGQEYDVSMDQLEVGDDIQLIATIRNMAGGPMKSGRLPMNDLIDVQYIEGRRGIYLENAQICITDVECGEDINVIKEMIASPNWVTVDGLRQLFPANATLSDWHTVKEQHQQRSQTMGQDLDFSSFGFQERK